jgi:hypothetical protein
MHRLGLLLFFAFIVASTLLAQPYENVAQPWEALDNSSMNPDSAYAFAGPITSPGRYDRNADGRVDLIVVDRNGDGIADYWATDRNFDGKFDDYPYDRNFNARIDQWEYDIDNDGISDKIYVDANNDGQAEMYATLNPITRTYTWFGDVNTTHASSQVSFPPLTTPGGYVGGKATDSN